MGIKDVNYENGYFTLTNIHANRIKKLNICTKKQ